MDLGEAHARIQQLERDINSRRLGQHRASLAPLAFLVSILLSLVFVGVGGYAGLAKTPVQVAEPAVIAPPAPPIPRTLVQTTFWNGPVTATIRTKDDVVAIFQANHRAELVALDGERFVPIWRTPIPSLASGTILKRLNDTVLLSDRANVRAFNVRTGAPTGAWTIDSPVREMCPAEDGSPKVYVEGAHMDRGSLIDLDNGKLTPAPKQWSQLGCHERSDLPLCDKRKGFPCEGPIQSAPKGKTLSQAYASYETAELVASVGWRHKEGSRPYYGAFFKKGNPIPIWEGQLSAEEDTQKERDFHYTFAGQSVVLVYKSATLKVIGHNAVQGKVAFTRAIGTEGTTVQAVSGTESRLYISLGDRILVLNPSTGETIGTIDSIEAVP